MISGTVYSSSFSRRSLPVFIRHTPHFASQGVVSNRLRYRAALFLKCFPCFVPFSVVCIMSNDVVIGVEGVF